MQASSAFSPSSPHRHPQQKQQQQCEPPTPRSPTLPAAAAAAKRARHGRPTTDGDGIVRTSPSFGLASSSSSSSSSLGPHSLTTASSASSSKSAAFHLRSPDAAQTFDLLAREAAASASSRAGRRRALSWRVVGWLTGAVLEGWLGFCTVRYLVALILLEPSVLRTLNLTFFVTSLLAFLLLPLSFLILLLPSSATQTRRAPTQPPPPTISLSKLPTSTSASRLFAYLAFTASLLLALLTAASQLAIYCAWQSTPAPVGFADRCGWDMDACWGRGGTVCEGWQWGGWIGVLCARLVGSAILFSLIALSHIQATRSSTAAFAAAASIQSARPLPPPHPGLISAPAPCKVKHDYSTTVRSVPSSTLALAAAAAAFVPPTHKPRSPPVEGTAGFLSPSWTASNGDSATGPVQSARHQWQDELDLGEKETLPDATAVTSEKAQVAKELAAHKALERARALANLNSSPRVVVAVRTSEPARRTAGAGGARYLRSTLPASESIKQHQQRPQSSSSSSSSSEAGHAASNCRLPPATTAIGLGLSAHSPDPAPAPAPPPSDSYVRSAYSASVSSSSADGVGPSSSASPVKSERESRRRWSATDVMKRKAVPTFLTLDLEEAAAADALDREAAAGDERSSTPRRPSSASATYALGSALLSMAAPGERTTPAPAAFSTPPPAAAPAKRMSRPKSLSPPSWSNVSSSRSDSSCEPIDDLLESADHIPSAPPSRPIFVSPAPRPGYASTPPSKLVDSRLSTLWSGSSEGGSSRLSDRRPSDFSATASGADGGEHRRSSLWSSTGGGGGGSVQE